MENALTSWKGLLLLNCYRQKSRWNNKIHYGLFCGDKIKRHSTERGHLFTLIKSTVVSVFFFYFYTYNFHNGYAILVIQRVTGLFDHCNNFCSIFLTFFFIFSKIIVTTEQQLHYSFRNVLKCFLFFFGAQIF